MANAAGASGQGSTDKPGAADPSVPGRRADDPFGLAAWINNVPMHPLMAHPIAPIAAATAFGFGMTSHMAGMMFGAMQSAMETLQKESTGLGHAGVAEQKAAEGKTEAPLEKIEPVAKPAKVSRRPAPAKAPEPNVVGNVQADDLKAISGIGPKLEQALQRLGIATIADVASLSARRATKVDEQLGLGGRMLRDDWVGQAKSLLQG